VSDQHNALAKTNTMDGHKTAMLVEPANFHKFQMLIEVDVIDQDQDAHVLNSIPQMDMLAFLANQVILLIKITETVSQLHHALVLTNILVLPQTAMPVELAHFHKSQLLTEEDAIDQFQTAHVLNGTQLMDTLARVAQLDKLFLLKTTSNVLMLHNAIPVTHISVLPKTVMLVDTAIFHKSQLLIEEDAIDQDQTAHVLNSIPVMDILALAAKPVSLLMQITETVLELQPVLVQTNTMELSKTAIDVELANFHKFQMLIELDVIDQDQDATVPRSTLKMVMPAFLANQGSLLITKMLTAFQLHNASETTKSLVPTKTVTDVLLATMV